MTKLTIVPSITTECSDVDVSNSDGAISMFVLSLVACFSSGGAGGAVETSTAVIECCYRRLLKCPSGRGIVLMCPRITASYFQPP